MESVVFERHAWISACGLLLAIYALYVEMRKTLDSNYVALCDFSEKISCSRILTSRYFRGFGLAKHLIGENHLLNQPNCILGILFYVINIFCGLFWPSCRFLFVSSLLSCVSSVYLAFILLLKLRSVCVVCVATYAVNFALLHNVFSNCP
ncbi:hypothetical protein CAPTEDRAFT_93839 [Capitella teleta]|uniref:vitamin-K-epoxide reductase (warfarin-sensitive) n=1 Tax=Capitella teleta TaxID=283909 RepID=R7TT57_CAPTE|nr:hypothetical protein CAPTEDRAFT_93839 [Capitella teleta]|eukprot:ELT94681.1 hypothetical protein CAPTEDRAFT_93839 [Capitella teleta]